MPRASRVAGAAVAALAAVAAGSADAQMAFGGQEPLTPAVAQAAYAMQAQAAAAQAAPQVAFPFQAPPLPGQAPPAAAAAMPRFAEHAPVVSGVPPTAARRVGDDGDDDDDDDDDDEEDEQQQQKQPHHAAANFRFASGRLPSAHDVVRQALVEAGASVESEAPATRTVPLTAAAAKDADEDDEDDADKAAMPKADKVGGAARFASGDDGMSDVPSDSEDSAPSGDESSAADSAASSDDSASASSGEVTPVSSGSPADVKKCKGMTQDGHCVIRWPRGDQTWAVKTVPTGSLKDEASSSGDGSTVIKSSSEESAAESSEEAGLDGDSFVLSKIPEVAAMQKKYRALHKELSAEVAWRNKVRGVIRSYQNKVLNVNAHVTSGKARLAKMRDEINSTIRKKKQERLNYELKCAVEALQKLQNHSQSLTTRISDISRSKSSLRNTIGRIKLALGRAANEDWTTQARFKELVLAKPPSQHEVKDAMRFAEANDEVKQHMANLLEVFERAEHPNAHPTADDQHEREAVRALPSLSLVEAGSARHAAAKPAEVAARRVEHHTYRAPVLPTPDTSVVDADVDPELKNQILSEKFDEVMRDTAANSYLD